MPDTAAIVDLLLSEQGWGLALLQGMGMTLLVSLVGMSIGAVLGTLLAWCDLASVTARHPSFATRSLRRMARVCLLVMRGLPELLIVYFVYFGSSALLTALGNAVGIEGFLGVPAFLAGSLAVGIISGAYQAESYRAAYFSIVPGEIEAARAFGLSGLLLFRRVVAIQILRYALPGLGNLWQYALKDSSLIAVTGLVELMRITQIATQTTRQAFLFYLGGALLYLVLTSVSTLAFGWMERRTARGVRFSAH